MVAVPPEESIMVEELSDVAGACFTRGDRVVDSVMVPLNPPRLINVIVEAPEVPCVIVREDGFTEMVKVGELLKKAVWTFSGTSRPPLAIVTQLLSLLVVVQPVWYPIVVPVVLPTVLNVIEKRRPVTKGMDRGVPTIAT